MTKLKTWMAAVIGTLSLTLLLFSGPGVAAEETAAEVSGSEDRPSSGQTPSDDGVFSDRIDYFARRFSAYDPMYFSFGWRGGFHAKFQLSFKFRLISEENSLAHRFGVLDDFYFGYTQFSLWDLGEESAPFRDTNYKPGGFYQKDFLREHWDGIELFGLRAGFEHESNGREGMDSRSLNIFYARPRIVLGDTEKFYFEIAPKAYVYVGDLSDNPDIEDYRGYVDLTLRSGYGNGVQVASTLRKGTEDHYGSVQVDVTYPLSRIFMTKSLGGFLHFQYFNGWGESLLDYNRKLESQLRVGIMILR